MRCWPPNSFDPVTRKQVFQPHHSVITDETQVQIYEELIVNTEGRITTSFVGLDHPVKNNRLLPKGWRLDGPFANVTGPHGEAEKDAEYVNKAGSSGADTITYRIALNEKIRDACRDRGPYYQSIPPYYLKERFTIAGTGNKRLAYITSHLSMRRRRLKWKPLLVRPGVMMPRVSPVSAERVMFGKASVDQYPMGAQGYKRTLSPSFSWYACAF